MTGSKLSFCFVEASFTFHLAYRSSFVPELSSPQTTKGELSSGTSPLFNGYPGVINRNGYVQRHLILPSPRIFRLERHIKFSKNDASGLVFAGCSVMLPQPSKHSNLLVFEEE